MQQIQTLVRNLVLISCFVPYTLAVINVTLTGTTTRHVCKGEDIDFKWSYDDTDPDKDFIKTVQWSKDPSAYLIMQYETANHDLSITSNPNDYTGRVERTTDAGSNDIGMRLKKAGSTAVDDKGKYYASLIVDKPGGDADDYFVPYRDPQGVQVYVCVGVDDTFPLPSLTLAYDENTHVITCSGPSSLGDTTFAIFDPSMNNVVNSTTDTTISKDITSSRPGGTYICKTYCTEQGYDDTPQGTCLPTDATLVLPAWSLWGNWTECTPGATRIRTRDCDDPPPAVNGPQSCLGDDTETEICPTPPPPQPVNGTWGSWAPWTECPMDCGIRNRSRLCNDPPPAHGGEDCPGSDSEQEECISISSISPLCGHWLGGTEISIYGCLGDSSNMDITVYIGNVMCNLATHEQNMAVFTAPSYASHVEGAAEDQPINVKIGDNFTMTWIDRFSYFTIVDVKPGKCNIRAGTVQTISGSNLDCVADPQMVVDISENLSASSNCTGFNDTTITCPCPPLPNTSRRKRATLALVSADLYSASVSFMFDGSTISDIANLTYYATVELEIFQSNYELSKGENVITIKGKDLTDGLSTNEYVVKIDEYTCTAIQVRTDEIQCTLSDEIINDLQGINARIVVYVGENVEFSVGLVDFPVTNTDPPKISSTTATESGPPKISSTAATESGPPEISNTTIAAIIGGVIGGLVLIVIIIIILIALMKRSRRQQKPSSSKEQYNYDVYAQPVEYEQPERTAYTQYRSPYGGDRPQTWSVNRQEYTRPQAPWSVIGNERDKNTNSLYYSRGLAFNNSYQNNRMPNYDMY